MEPALRTYVLKRMGFAVLMLVGVSIVRFALMRLAPGGPEAVLIGGVHCSTATHSERPWPRWS